MGEIGKNFHVFECGEDIIVVDCGLKFPEEDMLGIDFVIPDFTYLIENRDRIRGLFLTHGHEDHIGGVPFLLAKLDCPIYGTRLTLGLLQNKLLEHRIPVQPTFTEIRAGDRVEAGVFSLEFIAVCHSIPDGVGMAIRTPVGTVVHTGDFKLDATPIDGRVTDYGAFAALGQEGVLMLLSDSTNVEKEGFTPSERTVGRTFENLFRIHKDRRIVLSTFASNLHRSQQVFNVAARYNRKVVLVGRSMIANVELARKLGYVDAPDDLFVSPQEAESIPKNRLAVLTTGSQGEPFSGLVLMSRGDHRQVRLGDKDLVVISATPIPGNEKLVSRTIDNLFGCGCEVVYERSAGTHASGHASREELKLILSLVRPRYFVPVHGEVRHQVRHAQLAVELGVGSKNIFVLENGDVLSVTPQRAQLAGRVTAGAVLVDGAALGECKGSTMKERRELAEDGVLILSVVLNGAGKLAAPVTVDSRGFLHSQEARDLFRELAQAAERGLEGGAASGEGEIEGLKSQVRKRVREVLSRYGRSYPTIVPLITKIA
jgi:ribonuclease J